MLFIIILFLLPKTQNYPIVTLSAGVNQKLSKYFSKGFERSVYWNEHKTKNIMKIKKYDKEYKYFSESNFAGVNRFFVLVYANQDTNAKRFNAQKYYLPKDIIKSDNIIINGKNFYDQAIVSDIKRYEKIK